jgi:C4-type Zn-finger protein
MDQERQKKMLAIAIEITDGDIENVSRLCPYCENAQLIFSFTISKTPMYGLFVDCKNCGHREHFSLSSQPPNFRKELVLQEYQNLENQMIKFSQSKKGD